MPYPVAQRIGGVVGIYAALSYRNRYKSIVCDEGAYFRELVRYIRLNPLRAKLLNGLSDLDKYPQVAIDEARIGVDADVLVEALFGEETVKGLD